MRSHVIPQNSRASQAQLEPAATLKALFLLLLVSTALSCEMRQIHAQAGTVDQSTIYKLKRYQAMLQLIDSYYVDDRRVQELIDSLMEDVLGQLDPHSYYLDPVESEDFEGRYDDFSDGYGIILHRTKQHYVVRHVDRSSVAHQIGLLPGDKIERVADELVRDLYDQRAEFLFSGDEVNIQIIRKGGKERKQFRLLRAPLREYSVQSIAMLDHQTGYVYLERFKHSTATELKQALAELTRKGMRQLILDLRYNGGGLVLPALECANLFLRADAALTTDMRVGVTGLTYLRTSKDGDYKELPLAVLTNSASASASEMLAGILQDHDRALIVGQATYGKGLAQTQFRLPDGGSFMLSCNRFYLPSGRSIQRSYNGSSYVTGPVRLPEGDNTRHEQDTVVPHTGPFQTAGGRKVYGGQGILPEIVVELDTISGFVSALIDSGVIDTFLDEYLYYKAEVLSSKYDGFSFASDYHFKREVLPLLIKHAKTRNVSNASESMHSSLDEVLDEVKAHLAYRLFGVDGWRLCSRGSDRQLIRAIKAINDEHLVLQ